jgi:hypothetical protein
MYYVPTAKCIDALPEDIPAARPWQSAGPSTQDALNGEQDGQVPF